MKRSRPWLIAAVVLTLAIFVTLCVMAPRMRALHPDSSANFWYATTGVDVDGTAHLDYGAQAGGTLAVFDQDRFIYGSQYPFSNFSDNPYRTNSPEEVELDFPLVKIELARRAALNDPEDSPAAGYARWTAIPEANRGGIAGLLRCIDSARASRGDQLVGSQFPPTSHLDDFETGLLHVSRAARLYWVCFVFELVYLSGIVWFVLWPHICRYGLRRKLIHIAVLPFLLFLPFWFGYCNTAGPGFPCGGIVYQFICMPVPGMQDFFLWELHFLAALPPFMSVITQGRTVTFAEYFTFRPSIPPQFGPVNVAILSALLTALVGMCRFASHLFQRFRARRAPRGFPVVEVQRVVEQRGP